MAYSLQENLHQYANVIRQMFQSYNTDVLKNLIVRLTAILCDQFLFNQFMLKFPRIFSQYSLQNEVIA